MIDEELYVLATQELNGDGRREDLWARAIALASDDHDEARYLYTNLRVEELLQERKNGELRASTEGGAGTTTDLDSTQPSSVAGTPVISDTPKVEDLDFENLLEAEAGQAGSPDASTDSSESVVQHMQRKAEELNNELRSKRLGNDSTQSDPGNSTLDSGPGTQTTAERRITNQTGLFIGDDGPAAHDNTGIGDETDPLERTEPEGFSLNDNSLDLTAPDNLPPVYPAGQASAEQIYEETFAEHAHAEETGQFDPNPAESADYGVPAALAGARVPTETIDRFDATIEPELLSGRAFTVLKHGDGSRKAIKMGGSWPALLFTFPWLLYKRLWGTALVYVIMAAVLLFALVGTGMSLLDAGAEASLQQKLIFGAFALLSFVGLLYLPFKQGNKWVINKLQRKGYGHHTDINAQTASDALDLARE